MMDLSRFIRRTCENRSKEDISHKANREEIKTEKIAGTEIGGQKIVRHVSGCAARPRTRRDVSRQRSSGIDGTGWRAQIAAATQETPLNPTPPQTLTFVAS